VSPRGLVAWFRLARRRRVERERNIGARLAPTPGAERGDDRGCGRQVGGDVTAEAAPGRIVLRRCPVCGWPIYEGQRRCHSCGWPVRGPRMDSATVAVKELARRLGKAIRRALGW